MKRKGLRNLDQGKVFHVINVERRVTKAISTLAVIYIAFLIWTVMTNFGLFMKCISITFVVILIYFIICWIFYIHDWIKKRRTK